MDTKLLSDLHRLLEKATARPDWRQSLETVASDLRQLMMFDNLAVYLVDRADEAITQGEKLDVVYARALGRGKTAEADAAWGEHVASQVVANGGMVLKMPSHPPRPQTDRLAHAYLLGLPLRMGTFLNGAVVFVRFGGPEFEDDHIYMASLVAMWMAFLFERRAWEDTYQQLQEVQRRIRLQDDFLATISHELRTPLGFIKGYSTTLLRQDTTWDESVQREFLTIIDEEADRLAQLIDDLLESARLQSNTIEFKFQPLRLDTLIRDVGLRVRQRKPDLSLKMDVGPVPLVSGDPIHLTRIFENLFSNAIKYAPNSEIEVDIQPVGENLQVAFKDHGPGIPQEFLPMIFERFYRVPGIRAANTGTGLGLYICKEIVQAHRGKIWAESLLNQGTTFYIELPIEAPLKS